MKNQYPTFSMDAVRGADLIQRHKAGLRWPNIGVGAISRGRYSTNFGPMSDQPIFRHGSGLWGKKTLKISYRRVTHEKFETKRTIFSILVLSKQMVLGDPKNGNELKKTTTENSHACIFLSGCGRNSMPYDTQFPSQSSWIADWVLIVIKMKFRFWNAYLISQ